MNKECLMDRTDPGIEQLLEHHRAEHREREQSVGPMAAAVEALRESCATSHLLLEEMELSVGFHLELLDVALRNRFGNRWWEDLSPKTDGGS